MSTINNDLLGINTYTRYDFTDKDRAYKDKVNTLLNQLQSMFKYDGLPTSIPAYELELILLTWGYAGVISYDDGNLYAVHGNIGGEPDVYYRPTIMTIANPRLPHKNVNAVIGQDVAIIQNDTMRQGIIPVIRYYLSALVENELTMKMVDINARTTSLISASDDRTKVSAEKYLKDIEDGKSGVIGEQAFLDGVKTQPYASSSVSTSIKDLIEYEQYLKASLYNALGLNSNYNMKRETLTDSENQMNNDALFPIVDDMLKCRQKGCDNINELFGTNITVSLASSWEDNQEELELAHEIAEAQADGISEDAQDDGIGEDVKEADNYEN